MKNHAIGGEPGRLPTVSNINARSSILAVAEITSATIVKACFDLLSKKAQVSYNGVIDIALGTSAVSV